jgi:16S rRNA (uracil1498-N3)-methyltransferase
MRRYRISPDFLKEQRVQIKGDLYHHICDVCRIEVADKFELICGDGKAYLVELTQKSKKQAEAVILETRDIEPLAKPYVHLCLSIPRFQKMDTILEKAVELGVYEVLPFVSDFSFVRKTGGPLDGKHPRWMKIVQMATEQSGRGELMKLHEPLTLEDVFKIFNRSTNALGLFPYEGAGDQTIKEAQQMQSQKNPTDVWIFVGSEGGFSHNEVNFFRQNGLKPITLGAQVLRVETACLALVSVIKYHFDLMR